MKINILTLFPSMFDNFKNESIISKAIDKKLIDINVIDIRDFCFDKHKQADDAPFGGGHGMLLKPEPLFRAIEDLNLKTTGKIIFTSPQGTTFNQNIAINLSKEKELTIIAGHYEGIDQRVIDNLVDIEISIGDFVLTGGELPAMVICDALIRLIPGVIKRDSYENDSFFNGLLDYPQYTRPAEYRGHKVPGVLLSGHHKNIDRWRLKQSLKNTYIKRKDLFYKKMKEDLTKEEKQIIDEILEEMK